MGCRHQETALYTAEQRRRQPGSLKLLHDPAWTVLLNPHRARRCSAVAVGASEQSGVPDASAISPPESDAAPASADDEAPPRVKGRNGQPPRVAIFIEPSPFSHVRSCRNCPCNSLDGQPWMFGVRLLQC